MSGRCRLSGIVAFAGFFAFSLICGSPVVSWGEETAAPDAAKAVAAPKQTAKAPEVNPAAEKAAAEKKKKVKEAEAKLDKTMWEIDVTEVTENGQGKTFKDTLRFRGGRVTSDALAPDGFSASNFSLRIKGDKTLIWETMQSSEKNGIAFWRGDMTVDAAGPMRGAISRHIDDKTVKDYAFVSVKKDVLPDEAPQSVPAAVPAAEPPVVAPQAAPVAEAAPKQEPPAAEPVVAQEAVVENT